MFNRVLFIGGACLGVALMVSPAMGQRNPPKKANKYQATMVQGVEKCAQAGINDQTEGLNLPACGPVVPSDPGCVFTEKGGGKLAAKAKDTIKIQINLKGIDLACEGETLCPAVSVTSSSNNCASTGDCTAAETFSLAHPVDPPPAVIEGGTLDFPIPICCTVDAKGKCKIKGELVGIINTGNATELIVGEVGLLRTTVPGNTPGTRQPAAFRAGLIIQ